MNFSEALERMKCGDIMRREGWRDVRARMGIVSTGNADCPLQIMTGSPNGLNWPFMGDSEDVLADDWEVVE